MVTVCFLSQMLNILGRCHTVQLPAAVSREKSGTAQENTESGRCGFLMVSTGPQVEVWRTPLPQLHLSPSFMEEKVIALAVTSISRDPAHMAFCFQCIV